MPYNFDIHHPRENTASIKYDMRREYFGSEDVLPLWVADMDYATPDFIIDAIRARLEHPILGYSTRSDNYYQSIINWMKDRHGWNVKKGWISFSPGVVPAIALCIQAFTQPGDKIIVQSPVYFPFFTTVTNSGRQLIDNPLKYEHGHYTMDIDHLAEQIDSRTRMILLCSPHNPVGRVWSKAELSQLGTLCVKHNILIVSDEIHSDLVYPPFKHTPIANISHELAKNIITLLAPSKTFNIPGLATSSVICSNRNLIERYNNLIQDTHLKMGNVLGAVASEAAYTYGQDWLDEMLVYTKDNINFVHEYLVEHIPQIKAVHPEATYLLWLDCHDLGLTDDQLNELLVKEAKVALSPGWLFGKDSGSGFVRLNVAAPRSTLKDALQRIEKAVQKSV